MYTSETRANLDGSIFLRLVQMHGGLDLSQKSEFLEDYNFWPNGQKKSQTAFSYEIVFGDVFRRGGDIAGLDADSQYKFVVDKMIQVLGQVFTASEITRFVDPHKKQIYRRLLAFQQVED